VLEYSKEGNKPYARFTASFKKHIDSQSNRGNYRTSALGVLRNSDTGEVLSLAPLFDHNISLISRGYPSRAPSDALISDFTTLLRHTGQSIQIPEVSESEFLSLVYKIPFKPPVTDSVPRPQEFTAKYLTSRQSALAEQNKDLLELYPSNKR